MFELFDDASVWKTPTVKLAAGFAVVAIVASAIVGPSVNTMVAKAISPDLGDTDPITTATVRKPAKTKRYIVRRSVLQKSPDAQCRIFADGQREGDC